MGKQSEIIFAMTKKKKSLFGIMIFFQTIVLGQIQDTCNCKLVFGNWFEPTFVIYHHDTLATYFHCLYPRDTVYKMINRAKEKDTIFNPIYYNWIEKETFVIKNGEIGATINGTFYSKFQKEIQKEETSFKYYLISRPGKAYQDWGYPQNLLLSWIVTYKEPIKINEILSNCYTIDDPYFLNREIMIRDINRDFLYGIPYYEFLHTNDTLAFVRYETYFISNRGSYKNCHLNGIGEIVIEKPYPKNYRLKIEYLMPTCSEYLKSKFNYEEYNKK